MWGSNSVYFLLIILIAMITEERYKELDLIYYNNDFEGKEFTDEELRYFAQLDRCDDYCGCGA